MAARVAAAHAVESVSRGLTSDAKELDGHFNKASDDWVEAKESRVAWDCFYVDIHNAADRVTRRRRDNNAQRAAKENSLNVMEWHMHRLANCRHQLPEGVLSALVDRLRPVAWSATYEIFDTVLERIRDMRTWTASIERAYLIRYGSFSARRREAWRLSLRLRCACRRLQHFSY